MSGGKLLSSGNVMRSNEACKPFAALGITLLILWPIGLEQLFPLLIPILYYFVYGLVRPNGVGVIRLSLPKSAVLFIIFLFFVTLSMIKVEEMQRLITYSRDLMTWMCALLFFAHFYNYFKTRNLYEASEVGSKAFWIIILTCLVYILFGSIEFKSVGYLVSPGFIRESMTANRFLIKDFGEQLYFYGFTDRVSSFFGSPIHLALILFLLLPFALARSNLSFKIFIYIVSFAAIFYAQARIAMVLILCYPIMYAFTGVILRPSRSPYSLLLSILSLILAVSFSAVYYQELMQFLNELFFERRAGSADQRSGIYIDTIRWIGDSPLVGYGTQIDVPWLEYPLGSHSTPLGFAFKHGVIATIAMTGFLVFVYFSSVNLYRMEVNPIGRGFYRLLVTSLTCYFSILMINEFIVDLYHTIFLFSLMGAVMGTSRYLISQGSDKSIIPKTSSNAASVA